MPKYTLDIVNWRQVRSQLNQLCPEITALIDTLPNHNELQFVRARFPWGAAVEDGDQLWFYYNNEPINYCDKNFPAEIKALLNYNWQGIPVGIMTHNTLEWHINLNDHIIPIGIVKPGTIFSLYSIFDPEHATHVTHKAYSSTAGSRSLMTLPKISHTGYNERLSRVYGVTDHLCPKTLSQHWPLFKDIVDSKAFHSNWYCEMLLFTKDFIAQLAQHCELRYALLNRIWNYTAFSRNYAMYDFAWATFTEKLPNSIRNTPFIIETAKHVVKLALREVPGFVPVTDDVPGPVSKLTQAYLEVYRIRYYLPIFMAAEIFDGKNPVYYSLHRHTFFHPLPNRANASRTIDELKVIKRSVESFCEAVLNHKLPFKMDDTLLYQTLKEVEFEFFHPQGTGKINTDIDAIAKEDRRFSKIVDGLNPTKDQEFPSRSVFFNGCIRVRPKRKAPPKPSMKDFLMPMIGKKHE